MYWRALKGVPLGEVLAHRILWSLVTVVFLLVFLGQFKKILFALGDRRTRYLLGLSGLLIGFNWSLYILAVYRGEVVQASLGYYLCPLLSVALGVFVLGEKLNRAQILAVSLAAIGVVIMGWQYHGIPWIALGLASTFALYGFIKKRLSTDSLVGLGVETLWLLPCAIGYWIYLAHMKIPHAFFTDTGVALLMVGAGCITLAPLFFFSRAAQRMPLSTLGFFQYLSPTVQLIMAVAWFGEAFSPWHVMAFGCIWTGLVFFTLGGKENTFGKLFSLGKAS